MIRAVPDDQIEAFVDSLAERLASFEKHALVGAKALMNEVTLPPDAVFQHALSAFFASTAHPGTAGARGLADQARIAAPLRYRNASWPSRGGISGGMTAMMPVGELQPRNPDRTSVSAQVVVHLWEDARTTRAWWRVRIQKACLWRLKVILVRVLSGQSDLTAARDPFATRIDLTPKALLVRYGG